MGSQNARPKMLAPAKGPGTRFANGRGGVASSAVTNIHKNTTVSVAAAGINDTPQVAITPDKTKEHLMVHKKNIPLLEKHKWAFVKKVEKQTGCNIQIPHRDDTPDITREITITGGKEAVAKARAFLVYQFPPM